MRLVDKIIEIMKIQIKIYMAYVASTWAVIFVNILQIIIFYYIWMAVYGDRSTLHGINKTQIITYVILARVLFMLIAQGVNLWIAHFIQSGDIIVELLRPIDFQLNIYAARIGDFITGIGFMSVPALLVSVLLFGISLPVSIFHGFMFLISLLMAVTIAYFIEFVIGLLSFYTTNGWGLHMLKEAIISFFSGSLVPIAFFPGVLKTIVELLPFKDMIYTPIAIYLGILSPEQITAALIQQFLWVVVLFIGSRMFFVMSIRKVTVQGG